MDNRTGELVVMASITKIIGNTLKSQGWFALLGYVIMARYTHDVFPVRIYQFRHGGLSQVFRPEHFLLPILKRVWIMTTDT
jgi:hypothetical protein